MKRPSQRLARWQSAHGAEYAVSVQRPPTWAWTDPLVIRASVISAAVVAWIVAPSWPVAALGLLAVLIAPSWLAKLETQSVRRRRTELQAALPLAVDLLAAALSAGLPVMEAVGEVARVIPGPLGDDLTQLEQLLRMGAGHHQLHSQEMTSLAQVLGVLERSQRWGASASEELLRFARQMRMEQRRRGEAEVRKISVRTAGPLGLCFLPAFIALVVVPAVYGALLPMSLS